LPRVLQWLLTSSLAKCLNSAPGRPASTLSTTWAGALLARGATCESYQSYLPPHCGEKRKGFLIPPLIAFMIICVSRHEAPLRPRPPPHLRSPRPRAAASDRVLPLLVHTKLHLSLMLPLLIFVYPVSSPFLGWYGVALLRRAVFQQSTNSHPAPLAGRLTSPFAWATPVWDMLPCLALKCSRITSRQHRQYLEALISTTYLDTRGEITHALPTSLFAHKLSSSGMRGE
jgi:hypothetical protein